MIEMEDWFMIRELYAQGLNITAISDKTGYDRKTVKKYLDLTAVRLFREIQEMGFPGKETIVKDFVRKVRSQQGIEG